MAKGQLTVTVDSDIIDYHRANRTKLSKTVNDYLKALMGEEVASVDFDDKINALKAELAKAEVSRKKHDQVLKVKADSQLEADFKNDVLHLRDLFLKKEAGSTWAGKKFAEEFEGAKKKYDVSLADLVAMVEAKRNIVFRG